jgi:peptidoglycan hydrolase-like protein with peptidoglycan-binding domain
VYGPRNICSEVTKHTYARWSFVSGMSYGYSGNMGFPLPENWSFNQIQTLTIGSGVSEIEIDKNVHRPNSDPGTSSVNDPSSPADAFVAYIHQLYDLAKSHGRRDPSQLVMEFLRHEEYATFKWEQLIGDVDWDFINKVKAAGIPIMREFREPFFGIDLKVSHWGASCNGVFLKGKPSGIATNRGDVAGWGGDWMTFYGEWRRDSDSYSSGYTYCTEKLAKVDGNGTFKLRDLIEDADAYNIAMRIRDGANIADEVQAYYKGGGHLSRFKRFVEGRFGNTDNAVAIAKDMLMPGDDTIINGGRIWLIESTGGVPTLMPHLMPASKIDEFCQGFGAMLKERVSQENARVTALRAPSKHMAT